MRCFQLEFCVGVCVGEGSEVGVDWRRRQQGDVECQRGNKFSFPQGACVLLRLAEEGREQVPDRVAIAAPVALVLQVHEPHHPHVPLDVWPAGGAVGVALDAPDPLLRVGVEERPPVLDW